MSDDSWKIISLQNRLLEIHPTFTKAELTEDGIDIYFSDGNPMGEQEFIYHSETRNILEDLEDLLRDPD